MEFTKDIYFDNSLTAGQEAKITYAGSLFQNGSNCVNIVYGFGESWSNTTTKPMEKTDRGFVASIRMRNFDTFNFCFSDENNNWDNNNYFNYISPILPELQEDTNHSESDAEIDFGTDYSSSIDDIIQDILENTTRQDIITEKDNNSVDKILESINEESLPEIEALFNDLFFESVKEDEKTAPVKEISMEPELAYELNEVGKAMEGTANRENAELIRMFNELFELADNTNNATSLQFAESPKQEEVQKVVTSEEPKLNTASFNLDGLVSELLELVINTETAAEKVEETSLFEDIKAHEEDENDENSLTIIDSKEFMVSSRKLSNFYKIRKRIRLAFLKLARIPKDFVKQLGL